MLGNHTEILRQLVSSWSSCSQCNHFICQGEKKAGKKWTITGMLVLSSLSPLKQFRIAYIGNMPPTGCRSFRVKQLKSIPYTYAYRLIRWRQCLRLLSFPGNWIQKNVWILNKHSYRFANCCVAYLILFQLICSCCVPESLISWYYSSPQRAYIESIKDLRTLSPESEGSV